MNKKSAYLYILDTLADWEVGFLTAELNSARYLDKSKRGIDLIKIGNGLTPITTMGGFAITPDKDIADIIFNKDDLIILPGANTWSDQKNQKILDIVPSLLNEGVVVAAICGATAALADRGIFDNRNHTSNGKGFLEMFCPNYRGGDYYQDRPAIIDDNLITASGIAPLEFSYEVLKRMDVMKESTLEAWFQLYKTKEERYFFGLLDSMK
jgi:putative intracellular protease/amidase